MSWPNRIGFSLIKLRNKLNRAQDKKLEKKVNQQFFENRGFVASFYHFNIGLRMALEQRAKDCSGKKAIFFTFRDLHFIDWFAPIHKALEQQYGGDYSVFYVNFGHTLKSVGEGIRYWEYHREIEQRLLKHGIPFSQHINALMIPQMDPFPDPDLIITSETIRKEAFNCPQRVYLPHYTVPKAKDTLPQKIRYNHLFLPTRPPFSYPECESGAPAGIDFHPVGYPKMRGVLDPMPSPFPNNNPVILFAPSLELDVVQAALDQGILAIFRSMPDCNFILKLHPTLGDGIKNLREFVQKEIQGAPNILHDTRTSLQVLGQNSSLMITDFGSAGAEYLLSFGKRLVYLEVPKSYEGGADLLFRDRFAEAVCPVKHLEPILRNALSKGDLPVEVHRKICNEVLFTVDDADIKAAEAIHNILSDTAEETDLKRRRQ